MIDFTNCPRKKKAYAGANGNKISILYQDELYMLKFPAASTRNPENKYTNSCISEYIGCKIYESIGIPVQEVLLGTYAIEQKETKIVVACKDFTQFGWMLQDFASLKNQVIDSERNGYGTDLQDILYTFEQQTALSAMSLQERFWDMFIVDALIGNWDRHNGNWGFLYHMQTDSIKLAPVYDCGSCLFPQANEAMMQEVLQNKGKLHDNVFNRPTSAIMQNGKRINYFQFISSLENQDCNAALERIYPKICMGKIDKIIDEIPCISRTYQTFLKTILFARKDRILDFSYQKLQREKAQKAVQKQVDVQKKYAPFSCAALQKSAQAIHENERQNLHEKEKSKTKNDISL